VTVELADHPGPGVGNEWGAVAVAAVVAGLVWLAYRLAQRN
jgi:hypothetical protein